MMKMKTVRYPDDFPLFSGMDEDHPESLESYVAFLAAAIEDESATLLGLIDNCGEDEKAAAIEDESATLLGLIDNCGEDEKAASVMLKVLEQLSKLRGLFEEERW